jgi:H+/gluconate symporter-like permease
MKPLLFVGSMIAFGTVISTFDFVESIKSILSNQHPFITITLSNYVFSAISGSMSGAVSITLSLFSNEILASAAELGISHDLLHRVTTLSGITFDTLPTNGTTVSILYITGLKFKEIYKDYFFITVLNPFIVSLLVLFILLI